MKEGEKCYSLTKRESIIHSILLAVIITIGFVIFDVIAADYLEFFIVGFVVWFLVAAIWRRLSWNVNHARRLMDLEKRMTELEEKKNSIAKKQKCERELFKKCRH